MVNSITMNLKTALYLAAEAQHPELSMHELVDIVQNMEDFFCDCSESLAKQYIWSTEDLKALAALAYRGE